MMENTIAHVFWITDFGTPWSFDALRDFGAPQLFATKDTNGAITYPHLKADGKYHCTISKCFLFLCMRFVVSQILAPLGVLAPLDFHRWGGLGPHGPPCHHATGHKDELTVIIQKIIRV